MSAEATAPYERSSSLFRQVLANISEDDLDAQTPCDSWKVRDVISHLVQGADFFVTSVGGEPAGPASEVTGANYEAAFDNTANRILSAFQQPGVLDKMYDLPFGTMPGSALVGIATTDTFVHAWDVAKATGQPTNLDDAFAAELLARARTTIPDSARGADGAALFGPEQQAPQGASNADQLAAFLGRTV